jgi:DNA-binding NarL/FixJ family response regulator
VAILGPQAAVLERETELAELDSAFRDAKDRHGRVVVLEGPAGEGKSTLLATACASASDAGLSVLRARGGELEQEFPFGVMRQLFEPVLAGADEARRAVLLDGAASAAARALGLEPEDPGPVEPGAGTFHSLYWLTANVAEEAPAVLAVDDAHWADASSLRALDFLARRLADLPVALVVALRPDEPDAPAELLDELTSTPEARRLAVRPLGLESVTRIVRSRRPGADEEACEAAHKATAGNPFYLEELLRSLPAGDADSSLDSKLIAQAAIASLGDRVMRRIGRVAPEAQTLARSMAVLGDGTRLALAAELARIEEKAAGAYAHRLRRIEVLSAEDPFRFVHPLVRRSVYDSMSVTEREAAHRAAGEVLSRSGASPETVAVQLAALTPAGSAEVAGGIVAAAERAASRGATDEAVSWFARALEENAPEPARALILTGLGLSEASLRDPRAIDHLRQAMDDAQDIGLRARIATSLAELLVLSGQWGDARDLVRSTRNLLPDQDGEAYAALAAIELMLGTYSPSLGEGIDLQPALLDRLSKGTSWASHALAAARAVQAAHSGEEPQEVIRLVDLALHDDVLIEEVGVGRWPIANALIALIDIDEYDRAVSVSDEMREVARPTGSLTTEILASDHRGWIHARRGDLAAAEADLRPGLEMALAGNLVTVAATQLFYLQEALMERDSLADIAQLALALEPGPGAEGTWPAGALAMVRGRLRLLRREGGGLEDLRFAAELAQTLKMSATVWPIRSVLALALPPGDRDEAAELVNEELRQARAAGLARPEGVALRAAAQLAQDDERIELLRQSVEVLARSPARLEHGRSLVELGSALRRAGQRGDAREPLAAGLALAREGGALRLANRAAEELRAAGERRTAHVTDGPGALTASELRVARLAAEGASNPQIAQELFVSLKTIETHLSSAYSKLGLAGHGSRRRLAQALRSSN